MKTSVQVHLSALLAAAVIAALTARGNWATGSLIFLVSFGVVEASVTSIMRWGLRKGREEAGVFERSLASIPAGEIESRALAALAALEVADRTESNRAIEVPPIVAPIFSRYRRVVFPAGDFLELGPRDRGFVDVGCTFDGARLVVRESDGALFEWDRPGAPRSEAAPDYPSLHHWIVKNSQLLSEGRRRG